MNQPNLNFDWKKSLGPLLLVAAGFFMIVLKPFYMVDTGHRGVKTRFGEVISNSLPEGLYFFVPIMDKMQQLDVRVVKWADETLSYTRDVQNVSVAFTVNYRPDPAKAHTLYQHVGMDWASTLLPQVVYGKIKEVVGQYEAVELVSDRLKATAEIQASITESLREKDIIVSNFEINNLDFNDPFENAVEAKVVAIQRAEESKNKTVRISEEAKQKLIAAEAEAKSMQIRAEALTQNKSLVEYEAVQKWDGELPQYMLGNSTMPFLKIGQ